MACITLFAKPWAMATTQLARAVPREGASVLRFEGPADRDSLRMSWVVVSDNNGNRKLQIQWMPPAGSR